MKRTYSPRVFSIIVRLATDEIDAALSLGNVDTVIELVAALRAANECFGDNAHTSINDCNRVDAPGGGS